MNDLRLRPEASRRGTVGGLISRPAANVTPVTCDQLICYTCELFQLIPPQFFQH